jgi:hypothetical protein
MPVSTVENFNTLFNGLDMMTTQSGTMRLTSRIARIELVSSIQPTLSAQGLLKRWESGYDVGKRIEIRAIILMITNQGDYARWSEIL